MEAPSVLQEAEIVKGTLSIPKCNLGVLHLIFANDILVFCKGDLSNLSVVENFLNYSLKFQVFISSIKKVCFSLVELINLELKFFRDLGSKKENFPFDIWECLFLTISFVMLTAQSYWNLSKIG